MNYNKVITAKTIVLRVRHKTESQRKNSAATFGQK
jgi:hypothetical protein